jgi:chromosome segregation ATPase
MSERKCPQNHNEQRDICGNCGGMGWTEGNSLFGMLRDEHDRLAAENKSLTARVAELEADCKFLRDSLTGASEQFAAELAAAKEEIRQLKMSLGVLEMKEKVKGL